MSVRILTKVWESNLSKTDMLVMLALADCADDDGYAYPSVDHLVWKTCMARSTVQESLKSLRINRCLVAVSMADGSASTMYLISLEDLPQKEPWTKLKGRIKGESGRETRRKVTLPDSRAGSNQHPARNSVAPCPIQPSTLPETVQRNKEEPSLEPSLEPLLEPSFSLCSKEGPQEQIGSDRESKTKAEPNSADDRHIQIREYIKKYWLSKNPGAETAPWSAAEGKLLSQVLNNNPSWPAEHFAQCVRNRFKSEVNHSEDPRRWLSHLASYFNNPLDRFGKPYGQQQNRGATRQQQNIAAVIQGFGHSTGRVVGNGCFDVDEGLNGSGNGRVAALSRALPSGKD